MKPDQSPSTLELAHAADFSIGSLKVRPSVRQVSCGDMRETLQPRVMQALTLLAGRRGEVISRDDLIEQCWDGRIVGDDAINVCISKVRRLGEQTGAFAIETIPRVGYRLDETAGAAPAEIKGRRAPDWQWIAAASAIVLVLALGAGAWFLRAAGPVRVAVEPFAASPQDPAAQALAGRVRDEIAQVLTARQVAVSAPGSTRGARLIVAGALERAGGKAHVRVHIDDPRSNLVLWQGEFEGTDTADSPVTERTAARVTDLLVVGASLLTADRASPPEALKALFFGFEAAREGRVTEPVQFYGALQKSRPNVSFVNALYSEALLAGAATQPPQIAVDWRSEAERYAHLALDLDRREPNAYFALAQFIPPREIGQRERLLLDGLKQAPNNGSLTPSRVCCWPRSAGRTRDWRSAGAA